MAETQRASIRRYHLTRMIGRTVSLVVLVTISGVLIFSFIKRLTTRPAPIPGPQRAELPAKNILAITEGYDYVEMENGRPKYRLRAAKETTYDNGLHELEKMELISFNATGKEGSRIVADHGSYESQAAMVTFKGNVIARNEEGLEVKSEALVYDQKQEMASTDVAVAFTQGPVSGTATGALLNRKAQALSLHKDAYLKIAEPGQTPVEMRGAKAGFLVKEGLAAFEGNASVVQGTESGRADRITGVFTPNPTKELKPKIIRVEARGNSLLVSQEKGRASELKARDIDFFFDQAQRITQVNVTGGTRGRSLEADAPREMSADAMVVKYVVQSPDAPASVPASIETTGRTTLKLSPEKGTTPDHDTERILEADAVKADFQPGGKFLSRTEATGNALLTITPQTVTPQAERKKLRAAKFTAEFLETGNLLHTLTADNNAVAEFEPLQPSTKRVKRTLAGRQMIAHFVQPAQELADLTVDGEAKLTEADRQATAAKALYTASNSLVLMRGKPKVWDSSLRVDASEIDVNIESGESFARGKVLTTYYSREATGGAAPFRKTKAPIFIASDRAAVRHNEGAARYEGNARAWQDDNFVRGAVIELDKGEKTMTASGNVNSALYNVEREIEEKSTAPVATAVPTAATSGQVQSAQLAPASLKKRKEVVPIFATSDQMSYADQERLVRYNGNVKIQQGTDRIESGMTDVRVTEENRMESLTATKNVVLTQPGRRGMGERMEYTVANDVAILTGAPARIEDREREGSTTGQKLTLNLRDARIQAADEGGSKRVRTTHRIRQ